MAHRPYRQVCQVCVLDDFVSWEVEGPGLWRFTCDNPAHGEYSWLSTGRSALDTSGHHGLSHELGLHDDLPACFAPGEQLIEYGIVEYRYARLNPAAYQHIVGLYSHTGFGAPLDYSASAFIGAAIGRLGREGVLVRRPCKATGFWRYNGTLQAWGLAPDDRAEGHLSWAAFAVGEGVDPDEWPVELLHRPEPLA